MNLALSISISSVRGLALPFILSSANIDEDATQTDVVGALSSTFGTGPYTYSIVADPDSKFAISGSNLVVRTAATFNYETATSHSVTIRSTDSLAATKDRVFTISVNDVADGPTTVGAATTLEAMVGSPAVGVLVTGDLRDLFVSPTSQALSFVVSHGTIAGDGYTWSWTPATAQAETPSVTATDEDSQELTIDVGVTVAAANQAPTAGNLTIDFAVAEFGNPAISSSSPADNATGVAITVDPTVTFDRNIVFGASGSIYIYNVTGAAILETFDVATEQGTSPGQVSISGAVLTIRPTSDLTNSNEYAIQWTAGAVESVEGAEVAALSDTTTISFTTASAASGITTPPTLLGTVAGSTNITDYETSSFTTTATSILVIEIASMNNDNNTAEITYTDITIGASGRGYGTGTSISTTAQAGQFDGRNNSHLFFYLTPSAASGQTVQVRFGNTSRAAVIKVWQYEGADRTTQNGGTAVSSPSGTQTSSALTVTTTYNDSVVHYCGNRLYLAEAITVTGATDIDQRTSGGTTASSDCDAWSAYEVAATAGSFGATASWTTSQIQAAVCAEIKAA